VDADTVMHLVSNALLIALKLAGPFLLAGLVVGVIISIFQAATQLTEPTLQLVPKIAVVILILALAGPWMASSMVTYTTDLFHSIPSLVKGQ